jgi:hypothetical protein
MRRAFGYEPLVPGLWRQDDAARAVLQSAAIQLGHRPVLLELELHRNRWGRVGVDAILSSSGLSSIAGLRRRPVIVIEPVIVFVTAFVDGNAVAVIDTVDDDATALGSDRYRLQCRTFQRLDVYQPARGRAPCARCDADETIDR